MNISHCLYQLSTSINHFLWEQHHQEAFELLKEKLVSNEILKFPNFNLSFDLYCDASDVAVGTALCQTQEEKKVAIALLSKTLTKEQRNSVVIWSNLESAVRQIFKMSLKTQLNKNTLCGRCVHNSQ